MSTHASALLADIHTSPRLAPLRPTACSLDPAKISLLRLHQFTASASTASDLTRLYWCICPTRPSFPYYNSHQPPPPTIHPLDCILRVAYRDMAFPLHVCLYCICAYFWLLAFGLVQVQRVTRDPKPGTGACFPPQHSLPCCVSFLPSLTFFTSIIPACLPACSDRIEASYPGVSSALCPLPRNILCISLASLSSARIAPLPSL